MPYSAEEVIILKRLGSAIRALRKKHGWSQEDFAFRADLDRTYVSSIERGERNVSVLNIYRLAATLGVPAGQLLKEEEE